jgi:RHS repeat-associated protein
VYGLRETTVEQITSGGTVSYLHHDQAGSTRLITGSTGTVTGKCTYGAYGAPTCEGTTTTPLGYDAQYTSADTGLIYMRARVYDPTTAQFLTRDPLEAITGAPYSYAGDNPINDSDPVGLFSLEQVLSVASTVVTVGACLTPGVDVVACGPAIGANAAIQSGLVLASSRSTNEKIGLVLANGVLATGASLFAGIDELATEETAPGWIKAYLKTIGALVPSLPSLLEMGSGCG